MQLWSQLCLDASLIVVESNKFSISLSAQLQSNADIRPPRGVPSACLKSISMTFHISTCRRTRYASRAQVAVSPFRSEHTSASTDPIEKHFDRRCYCPLSSLGGSQGVLDTLTDGYAPWIFGASSVDTSPMSSQGSISSDADSTTSFDTLTDTPTTSHEYAIHEIKFELLVRLLDFSLRRMISDYKPGRSGGVVLSTDSGSPKLAAISPALFSPGYAKVRAAIDFHNTADSLTSGGFPTHWATSHDRTYCVSDVSPHELQPPETQAQAITRIIIQ